MRSSAPEASAPPSALTAIAVTAPRCASGASPVGPAAKEPHCSPPESPPATHARPSVASAVGRSSSSTDCPPRARPRERRAWWGVGPGEGACLRGASPNVAERNGVQAPALVAVRQRAPCAPPPARA